METCCHHDGVPINDDSKPREVQYAFPENDPVYEYHQLMKGTIPGHMSDHHHKPDRRSQILEKLLVNGKCKDEMQTITDMAFNALDSDGSGGLEQAEIYEIMKEVSKKMKVAPPND